MREELDETRKHQQQDESHGDADPHFAANAGLGYLIIYGQNIFNMSLVMTSLVILTVIAGVMYYAVSLAERYFVPWQRG